MHTGIKFALAATITVMASGPTFASFWQCGVRKSTARQGFRCSLLSALWPWSHTTGFRD